jgi:hypothetical protein
VASAVEDDRGLYMQASREDVSLDIGGSEQRYISGNVNISIDAATYAGHWTVDLSDNHARFTYDDGT